MPFIDKTIFIIPVWYLSINTLQMYHILDQFQRKPQCLNFLLAWFKLIYSTCLYFLTSQPCSLLIRLGPYLRKSSGYLSLSKCSLLNQTSSSRLWFSCLIFLLSDFKGVNYFMLIFLSTYTECYIYSFSSRRYPLWDQL